jgi:hypothetical protein
MRSGRGPRALVLWVLVATLGLAVRSAAAQETASQEGPEEPDERANTLASFLGGTIETVENETYFTLGLEYERELSHRWALMAVAEHVFDLDAWVIVAPVAWKPMRGLSLMTGPGLETTPRRPSEGEAEGHTGSEAEKDGPFFLWRFGIGYTLPIGEGFAVTPNLDLDLVREDGAWKKAWVFGVSLGIRF